MRYDRRRATLKAIVAVPDDYGRLRFLIPTGTSLTTVVGMAPAAEGRTVPYKTWPPDGEGLKGEFHATAPAKKRTFWLSRAAELRGQTVDVEVAVRRYSFCPQGAKDVKRGYAFDLVDIREAPRAEGAGSASFG